MSFSQLVFFFNFVELYQVTLSHKFLESLHHEPLPTSISFLHKGLDVKPTEKLEKPNIWLKIIYEWRRDFVKIIGLNERLT